MENLYHAKYCTSKLKLFSVGLCKLLLLLLILNISCTEKAVHTSPAGYNLEEPEKFVMPESLLEISGITIYNGDSSTIYALQDEEGRIFQFKPKDKQTSSSQFAKHGDYEDLAIARKQVIVLRSDGTLFTFPLSELSSKKAEAVKEQNNLLPKGEYEGIYADENKGLVYVLCKECKKDKGSKSTSGYIFSISANGDLTSSGQFEITSDEIANLSGKEKIKFRPSALARNNRTSEWYIVSSVNKQLIVTDDKWLVKEVHPLNFGAFFQPEGITFDSNHNLYISNEGDDLSNGNILKFKFSNR